MGKEAGLAMCASQEYASHMVAVGFFKKFLLEARSTFTVWLLHA